MLSPFDSFALLVLGIVNEVLLINEEFVVLFSFLLFCSFFFVLYLSLAKTYSRSTQIAIYEKFKNILKKSKLQLLAAKTTLLFKKTIFPDLVQLFYAFFDIIITFLMFNIWFKAKFGRILFSNLLTNYVLVEKESFRFFFLIFGLILQK